MRITLSEEQKAHCIAIGIANPPEKMDVPDREWHHAVTLWKRVGGDIDHELKAVGHIAWQQSRNVGTEAVAVAQAAETVVESKPLVSMKNVERLLALIAFLLVLLVSETAHCQWSQIKTITFQNSDSSIAGLTAAPFTLKVANGCTWSHSGPIWTIGCTTGTVTNNPGTPDKSIQYACSGAFCGIPEAHLGAVLIDQGPGVAPAFADPLVQGLVAAGSTSLPNPVVMGGSDYGGTAAVRTAKVDASGNVSVTPTATPNPSNLDVAASTLAKETGGNLAAIKADVDKIPAQGQALAAASMPVVLPAAQITTLTPPAAITNFANETGGNLAAIKADVDKIPALGQALAAASVPVVLTAAQLSTLTPPSTVTTTPPANASTNIAQVAGTTVDTNSGNKSAGTQRFVLATDQPNLTTPLNVNCTSGCTAGGSFADSSAFTFATSAIGNMGAVVDDVATNTVAENSAGAVRMNTNRILYVDLSKTAANTNKILVTPDSVALPANQSVNVSQINGVTPLMGNGVAGTGSQRVTIASDNTAFPVNATLSAETTKVIGTVNIAAAQTVGVAAGSAIIGKVGIDQTTPGTTNAVQVIAGTTGGGTPSYLAAAATTNATSVKASAGTVYHISVSNVTATVYYLRMYNLATAPTCSSATGFVETIPIPAATTVGGREIDVTVGQAYGTGIAFCITGGASSTDNTSAATGVFATITYK